MPELNKTAELRGLVVVPDRRKYFQGELAKSARDLNEAGLVDGQPTAGARR
jgi:hypothetical protein